MNTFQEIYATRGIWECKYHLVWVSESTEDRILQGEASAEVSR